MRLTQEQLDAIGRRQARPGAALPAAEKRSKFGNKVTIHGGMVFASGHEARRYGELQLLEQAGRIRNLQRQVPYDIVVNGQHICTYVADAVYERMRWTGTAAAIWERVVEDAKSPPTRKRPEYRLKAKLMAAVHGIVIKEVV